MSAKTSLFYSLRGILKRFSWLALLGLWLAGCGSAGGINLPAPVADLEGGTVHEATVCDTVDGAPPGAFVRVRNTSNSQVTDVDSDLDANNSFSLQVCVQVGENLEIQIFDSGGAPISGIATVTRPSATTATCPTFTNTAPTCP